MASVQSRNDHYTSNRQPMLAMIQILRKHGRFEDVKRLQAAALRLRTTNDLGYGQP